MFEELKTFLVDELRVNPDDVTMEAELTTDLGINSLELADLVYLCEEKFNIVIDDEELHNFNTVGDIVSAWRLPTVAAEYLGKIQSVGESRKMSDLLDRCHPFLHQRTGILYAYRIDVLSHADIHPCLEDGTEILFIV